MSSKVAVGAAAGLANMTDNSRRAHCVLIVGSLLGRIRFMLVGGLGYEPSEFGIGVDAVDEFMNRWGSVVVVVKDASCSLINSSMDMDMSRSSSSSSTLERRSKLML